MNYSDVEKKRFALAYNKKAAKKKQKQQKMDLMFYCSSGLWHAI